MRASFFITVLSLCFSLSSFAADLPRISQLFSNTFWTGYSERYCGLNIENLVRECKARRIDLSNAYVMQITDESGWMFLMVNAMQAREGGRLIPMPTSPAIRSPGEKNWNFHVVLFAEGKIIDYDFMNEPKVLTFKNYLNQMFIPKEKQTDLKYKKDKMSRYKLTLYPAEAYLQHLDNKVSMAAIKKEVYLKDFLPAFFE